jgi:hypothetical protein
MVPLGSRLPSVRERIIPDTARSADKPPSGAEHRLDERRLAASGRTCYVDEGAFYHGVCSDITAPTPFR